MDNQLFEMITERFDRQDEALKGIQTTFDKHAEEDRKVWQEVWFVKKLLYGAWIGLLGLLGWKGLH